MKSMKDNNYGADSDNNRGISVIERELDNSPEERMEIAEKLYPEIIK